MATLTRFNPTTEGAAVIRAALSAQGILARVAKQRHAYRVVTTDARATEALVSLGLSGPIGGTPARSADCHFAYDFRGIA